MHDDHTPIRRTTRKRGINWTPIILGGVAVACGIAFVVGVMARAGQFSAHAAELRGMNHWNNGATGERIQRLLNAVMANHGSAVVFDTNADFCVLYGYKVMTVLDDDFGGNVNAMADAGVSSQLLMASYFAAKNPTRVSDHDFFARPHASTYILFVPDKTLAVADAKEMVKKCLRSGPTR